MSNDFGGIDSDMNMLIDSYEGNVCASREHARTH